MLVLSRNDGETVDIGGLVAVTVVEVRGDRVRLGIEAPEDMAVHRREVVVKIAKKRGLTLDQTLAAIAEEGRQ